MGTTLKCTSIRCVMMENSRADELACYTEANTAVRCIAAEGSVPNQRSRCIWLEEGPHRFIAFENEFEEAFSCSEVSVSRVSSEQDLGADMQDASRQRLPPLRIDAKCVGDNEGEWRT